MLFLHQVSLRAFLFVLISLFPFSHYHDLPPELQVGHVPCLYVKSDSSHPIAPTLVQSVLGPLPAGFVSYFQHRFPMLLVLLHDFVQTQGIASNTEFVAFFADFGTGSEA